MSRKTRKLIWSVPLVAVLAVAGAVALFVALTPNSAQAHDLPGPVSNLKAEGVSHTEIKLTWDASTTGGAATGYRIDVSEDQFVWESLMMNTGNTMVEYTAGGLKAGNTRYYRVFAVNAAGAGSSPVGDFAGNDLFVSGKTLDAVVPGQVRSLKATAVNHDQIDLTWNEPAMTGGESITKYCIVIASTRALVSDDGVSNTTCRDGDLSDPERIIAIATALNADEAAESQLLVINAKMPVGHTGQWPMLEHDGLDPELTLYYQAYAANSVGLSGTATNIASATTKKTPKPGKPSGLKLVTAQTTGVDLYWNWPSGQLDIADGEFQIRLTSNTLSGYTDPILTAATDFPVQDNHIPGEADSGDFAALIEDAIEDPPGTTAVSATKWIEYQVRVNLADGATGDWSQGARIAWPLPARAGLPGLIVPAADDLSETATLTSITLSWTREGDPTPAEVAPTGFVIDTIKGTGGTNTADGEKFAFLGLQTNTSYTTETYRHPGLKPSENWYYRAFPYRTGDGSYGVPLTLQATTDAASPPDQLSCEQVQAAADGPTKIALTWPRQTKDGGSAITGYLVQVSDDTNDDAVRRTTVTWMDAPNGRVDSSTLSYTYAPKGDIALEANDVRWFRVIVLNGVNTDTAGDIFRVGVAIDEENANVDLSAVCENVRGKTAAAGTPGQPDGLVTEPARDAGGIDPDNPVPDSERGVLLLWNAPDDPAGDEVTGYIIARRVKDDSASAWGDWDEEWAEIDDAATSDTDEDKVANLDSGEARQYRIVAQSGSGTGAWTPVITYPHNQAMHAPATTAVMAPSIVEATDGTVTVTVTWVDGENATGHLVMLFTADFSSYVFAEADGNSHTFMDVATGDYVAVVVAYDAADKYKFRVDAVTVN